MHRICRGYDGEFVGSCGGVNDFTLRGCLSLPICVEDTSLLFYLFLAAFLFRLSLFVQRIPVCHWCVSNSVRAPVAPFVERNPGTVCDVPVFLSCVHAHVPFFETAHLCAVFFLSVFRFVFCNFSYFEFSVSTNVEFRAPLCILR